MKKKQKKNRNVIPSGQPDISCQDDWLWHKSSKLWPTAIRHLPCSKFNLKIEMPLSTAKNLKKAAGPAEVKRFGTMYRTGGGGGRGGRGGFCAPNNGSTLLKRDVSLRRSLCNA